MIFSFTKKRLTARLTSASQRPFTCHPAHVCVLARRKRVRMGHPPRAAGAEGPRALTVPLALHLPLFSQRQAMNACFILLSVALYGVTADYLEFASYQDAACTGQRGLVSFNGGSGGINGECDSLGPDQWGNVNCVSATSANINVYSNPQCTGTPILSPVQNLGVCTPQSGTIGSINTTCIPGMFPSPGPRGGLVVTFFAPPATCPITTQKRSSVSWVPVGTCITNSVGSTRYSCASGEPIATFETWGNTNCGGTPTQTSRETLDVCSTGGGQNSIVPSCTFATAAPFYTFSIYDQLANDPLCATSCSGRPPSDGPVSAPELRYPPPPAPSTSSPLSPHYAVYRTTHFPRGIQ